MKSFVGLLVLAGAAALGPVQAASAAEARCKLELKATIPIKFVNDRPMVEATINGKPALLRFSMSYIPLLWKSTVEQLRLPPGAGKLPWTAIGPGGDSTISDALIRDLKVGDSTGKNLYMMVVDNFVHLDEAGVYGLYLTGMRQGEWYDIEYDFPHNAVRIFKPSTCSGDQVVYWGSDYTVMNWNYENDIDVKIGDKTYNAYISPGAEISIFSAGNPDALSNITQAAGSLPMGMLPEYNKPVDIWIDRFSALVIGDETIKNAALAVGDLYPKKEYRPEIVLGADFVKAHRIYISRNQRKTYFTYTGGPVFTNIYKRFGVDPPPEITKSAGQ